jgi:predicted benzoate:H+ symporter BenE
MDFDTTAQVLDALAAAVRRRREVHPDHARRSRATASA